MNELNHSEGKFDLKVVGDFSKCKTEITSSITDDQLIFKIDIKSGSGYIEECLIMHRCVVLNSGFLCQWVSEGEDLTIDYTSRLIRFIK